MPKPLLSLKLASLVLIISLLTGIPGALAAVPSLDDVTFDPVVQMILDQVDPDQLEYYDRQMVGEYPVWVDGAWYTIPTRYTYSGVPIQKTTHWAGQHMEALGLDVSYQVWDDDTNPNVIGEITGLTNPEDIFIIGGHIDAGEDTPGADDDASGSAATLIAADILSQYQWGCTLRFALWTGEEQWMLGSSAYAGMAHARGDNILAYLNLDMLGWNTPGSEPGFDLWYEPSVPGSQEMAEVFGAVVPVYGLDLVPELIEDFDRGGDHESFWNNGYASIMVIEDYNGDFNPNYHGGPNGAYDIPDNMDFEYFTNYSKASLATFLHLSGCIITDGIGTLDGHVTDAASSLPISGAGLTLEDSAGHEFSGITDPTGYYTETLPAGVFTATVETYGYQPLVIGDIEIITGTNTTVDFALQPKPVHTVSGYVFDGLTLAPVAAQVEFLDAPLPPVQTDPLTGFYSIDVAEGVWELKATAAGLASSTQMVEVLGSVQKDFYLSPFCNFFHDDVENGTLGWTAQSPWAITTESFHSPSRSWTDSPGGGYSNNANTALTSPVFDLTGYSGVSLGFWHSYQTESGWDYAHVEYSINGGASWVEAARYDGSSSGWVWEEIDLPQLDGQPDAQVRFRLTSDTMITQDGWHLDDIALVAGGPVCLPPEIDVLPTGLSVGLDPGQVLTTTLTIANLGPGDLVIESIDWDPTGWFSLIGYTDPSFTIAAGETFTAGLQLTALDVEPGRYSLDLVISSNDPDEPQVTLRLELLVRYQSYLPLVMKGFAP